MGPNDSPYNVGRVSDLFDDSVAIRQELRLAPLTPQIAAFDSALQAVQEACAGLASEERDDD